MTGDIYRALEKDHLLWRLAPKWHVLLAAVLSAIVFSLDVSVLGKKGFYGKMRQVRKHARVGSFKFCYLYHFYSIRNIFNYGRLLYAKPEYVQREISDIKVLGLENLGEALTSNRAVVAFSAHTGCFFNIFFSELVMKHLNDRSLLLLLPDTSVRRKRIIRDRVSVAFPKTTFDLVDVASKTAGIKIIRSLKENGVIGCTLDYAFSYTRNKMVQFMGKNLEFTVGLVELGRKLAVVYMPCFCYHKDGEHIIEFMKIFPSVCSKYAEEDIDIVCNKISTIFEKKIMEIPEQWIFWPRLCDS